MENVRSSQPCISMNFWTEFSKVQVFLCEYRQVKGVTKISKLFEFIAVFGAVIYNKITYSHDVVKF